MDIKGLNTKGLGISTFDNDALAFLSVAGITDSTQRNAVNNLTVQLKNNGLWSKMDAIYPFVGGTATSHKWNLKDPQDTDAAFRLGFFGGWTHDSTGAIGNGSNTYARNYLVFDISYYNDISFSAYATNLGTSGWLYGMGIDAHNHWIIMNTSNFKEASNWYYTGTRLRHTVNISRGFGASSRLPTDTANNLQRVDGIRDKHTHNRISYPGSDEPLREGFWGARHLEPGYSSSSHTNSTLGFGHIGRGMTEEEIKILEHIVEGYNLQLGR